MNGTRALVVAVGLASAACLVEPNPKFIESGSDSDTGDHQTTDSGGQCEPGTLDCDGMPGCEADAEDPMTCGACNKSCEAFGATLDCVAGECTGTLIFSVPADAYVSAAQPDQNFGTAATLRISDQESTYLELPPLNALPDPATIESAELHLDATLVGTDLDLYRVEAPWDELSLTQANAPAIDGDVLTSFTPKPGDNALELVDLLGAWQVGAPKHSIALRPTAGGPPNPAPVEFSSREGAKAPYMVLKLSW